MLDFAIQRLEHGWLDARLSNGTEKAAVTASYLSDAPRDLLAATADLAEGASEATVSWMEEPGQYRFQFHMIGGELHLRVLWFDDWSAKGGVAGGKLVFVGKDQLQRWGRRLTAEFNRLLREYGEAGYRKRWTLHDFPAHEYHRLQKSLAR